MADLQPLYKEQLKHFLGTNAPSPGKQYAEALVDDFYWLKPLLNFAQTEETAVKVPPATSQKTPAKAEMSEEAEQVSSNDNAAVEQAEKALLFKELFSFAEGHVQSTGLPLSVSGSKLEIGPTESGTITISSELDVASEDIFTIHLNAEKQFLLSEGLAGKSILILGMEIDSGDAPFEGEEWNLLFKMLKATQIPLEAFGLLAMNKESKQQDPAALLKILRYQALNSRIHFMLGFGSKVCSSLLGQNIKLGPCHGKSFEREIQHMEGGEKWSTRLTPFFHPEFLKVNPNMKKMAWDDLKVFMAEYFSRPLHS